MFSMIAQTGLVGEVTGGGLLAIVVSALMNCYNEQKILRTQVAKWKRKCRQLNDRLGKAKCKTSRKQAVTACLTTLEELVGHLKAMKSGLDSERATEAIKRAQALIPEFREMLDSA